MPAFQSLFRVELAAHHLRPGRAEHRLKDASGVHDFPPFRTLEICSSSSDGGFYLMYEPESGLGTDTWHETLNDAFGQAEWEFGVSRNEWAKTDRPY